MAEVTGPRSIGCPDCGNSVIQFLVGWGAFCRGCGRCRGRISGEDPWRTVDCDAEEADSLPRIDPTRLTALAVEDVMSGRTLRPGEKHWMDQVREQL